MANKHDKKVEQIAKRLEREGYTVKTDISGYETPDGVGKNNYIPDIVAKKTSSTKIIEVETQSSLKTDKDQQEAFKRSAAQSRGTSFGIEMAD
ncbi:hypothetical protein ES708_21226 [subsurface metagenome]